MKAHIFNVLETIHGKNRLRQGELTLRAAQSQNHQLERVLSEKNTEIEGLRTKIENLEARLSELTDTDNSTGLPSKESFKHHLLHSVKRALRLGYSLTVLIVSIDNLNDIENNHGKENMENAINKTAKILHTSVREVDMAARWDKHELIAVLHETDSDGASLVSKRINKRINNLDISNSKTNQKIPVEISIGIAQYTPCCGEAHDLIADAYEALIINQKNKSKIAAQ